jgi:hypothetical protein
MINAQLSLEAVRRLASSINSQLVRQHIEHIDFDRFLHELDVQLPLNEGHSDEVRV